jgi:hypothetical protein
MNYVKTFLYDINLFMFVPVWSPYLKRDIREIEAVQRRATKQINDIKDMDYTARLKRLKFPP